MEVPQLVVPRYINGHPDGQQNSEVAVSAESTDSLAASLFGYWLCRVDAHSNVLLHHPGVPHCPTSVFNEQSKEFLVYWQPSNDTTGPAAEAGVHRRGLYGFRLPTGNASTHVGPYNRSMKESSNGH